MKKTLLILSLMFVIAGQANAASTQTPQEPPKAHVSFPEAKKMLVQMMEKREQDLESALQKMRSFRKCIEKAQNEADAGVCSEQAKKTLK